jgi:hypothetical protein
MIIFLAFLQFKSTINNSKSRSRSQSLFTTDTQSVSQSACLGIEHPCGTCNQILLPVAMLLSEIGYSKSVYSIESFDDAEQLTERGQKELTVI